MNMFRIAGTLGTAVGLALAATTAAQAQATVKPDGQWRASLGLGASMSSGNSKTTLISLVSDGVRATDQDKMTAYANLQYAKSAGVTSADQQRLGGRYDYNLNPLLFGFAGLDLERNKLSNIGLRGMGSAGVGYHAVKGETTTLDVFGGLGYTTERYVDATTIDGSLRKSYNYLSLILGEESTHRLSDTTSAKQKLVVVPNLKNRGEFRATWDAGVAVAMSKAMNLTAGFQFAYNTEPGTGRKKTDTLLTTGVSVKFD